jgi:hypothetical protein
MKNFNKLALTVIALFFLSFLIYSPAFAKAGPNKNSSASELIQSFKDQIDTLKQQIEDLKDQLREKLQENIQEQSSQPNNEEEEEGEGKTEEECKINRRLWIGMQGDDITTLQELLATDPDIYPEGLVTGYFGRLTYRAVQRFQKYACLDQVGVVGPKTLDRIREVLEEGAGKSGKIPGGLLTSPGIRKKFRCGPQFSWQEYCKKWDCATTTPPTDGNDNTTTTPDIIAPVISGLCATSTTASTTKIIWTTDEEADSKFWYSTSSPAATSSESSASSSILVLSHEFDLSGLNSSTTYYYIIASADEAANTAFSTEKFFTTLPEEL